jgi:hypothetical protein
MSTHLFGADVLDAPSRTTNSGGYEVQEFGDEVIDKDTGEVIHERVAPFSISPPFPDRRKAVHAMDQASPYTGPERRLRVVEIVLPVPRK